MRAATELLSLLQTAGSTPLWRADELPADDAGGPILPSGFAELDHELPGGGWPQGQLIELLTDDAGIGELSLLAPALAQLAQSRRCTVWVLPVDAARAMPRPPEAQAAHASMPYAPALATAGLDLARTIFVKPATPRESLWAVEQSLRARHLGAVVGWLPHSSGMATSARCVVCTCWRRLTRRWLSCCARCARRRRPRPPCCGCNWPAMVRSSPSRC